MEAEGNGCKKLNLERVGCDKKKKAVLKSKKQGKKRVDLDGKTVFFSKLRCFHLLFLGTYLIHFQSVSR